MAQNGPCSMVLMHVDIYIIIIVAWGKVSHSPYQKSLRQRYHKLTLKLCKKA